MATPQDKFSFEGLLPEKSALPQGFGEQFLRDIDAILAKQEQKQLDRLLTGREERGLLRSGGTARKVAEDVLGPSLVRRRQALSGILLPELRRERGFQQRRQFAGEEFDRRLRELNQQLANRKELLRLESELAPRQEAPGFGGILGQAAGSLFGSAFGGFGGGIGGRLAKGILGG